MGPHFVYLSTLYYPHSGKQSRLPKSLNRKPFPFPLFSRHIPLATWREVSLYWRRMSLYCSWTYSVFGLVFISFVGLLGYFHSSSERWMNVELHTFVLFRNEEYALSWWWSPQGSVRSWHSSYLPLHVASWLKAVIMRCFLVTISAGVRWGLIHSVRVGYGTVMLQWLLRTICTTPTLQWIARDLLFLALRGFPLTKGLMFL